MGFVQTAVVAALCAVAVQYAIELAFQPTFVVHGPPGAVVVTGASSGIGEHAAIELATLGYTVFAGVRCVLVTRLAALLRYADRRGALITQSPA